MSTRLTVTGMHCGGCEANVEAALKGVPGVTDATADRESDSAMIDGDALIEAVEAAGYTASN